VGGLALVRRDISYGISHFRFETIARLRGPGWQIYRRGSTAGSKWNSAGWNIVPSSSVMWIFQPSSMNILAFATVIKALALVLRMISLSRSATI
jgi:hypothetical protein